MEIVIGIIFFVGLGLINENDKLNEYELENNISWPSFMLTFFWVLGCILAFALLS